MRDLSHINGLSINALFPGSPVEPRIKIVSVEDVVQAKPTLTDLPGEHGGVQGTPKRDVRRFTIRGILYGTPGGMDEPMRVLRRLFAIGLTASDTLTLGFTERNFPGAGPHWTIEAMPTDFEFAETGIQHVKRWQCILTAADPDYYGRTYTYPLAEGYHDTGRTYDKSFSYAYGASDYVNSKTVFLEGSAESRMSAVIYGPAVNPRITNAITGDYLLLSATLGENDVVTIAEDGTIKLNGQFRNSLRAVGTWLPGLRPGVNEIVLTDDTSPLTDDEQPTAEITYTTRDA